MATTKGPGPNDLSHFDRLAKAPEEHHVFQALRVLEAHYRDSPRLGESRRPRQDPLRLGQEAELAFPPSTIASFTPATKDGPARLTNRFFGLFGPQGPLPLHMTEYARDRYRNHRDPTLVGFADMLTHRMMSLLYRAWAEGAPAVSFDRDEDPLADRVAALAGYHGTGLRNRDEMPDLSKLHFTGIMAQGTKTPAGLVALLSDFFQVPVHLEEFVGSWLELEPDDRWQMGRGQGGLGQNTSLGERVWSRSAKFRLRIGPLSLQDYERLLPGGAALARLRAIVRNYLGDFLDWDVNLVLAGDAVPRASLGGTTRLGHTSWIRSRPDPEADQADVSDLYLYPGLHAGT
ncbi:type VI secretion system baseplate subunit TssG [Pseudophaeobacter flagellatus]|uniref:type VI secretion system baseplate subunit TssG n=1 Tax=Pseudophaeobacter flagellatus TaxID=2899119 RepID=UPI001E47ECFF|nr:type VI secretion system baseplate subunit TssG [Pseudophaeobacter flagellatus]MCD9149654.1 type VI secretion system baseplate subunit TssG [Pseudophaeobacter flagellatus]